MRKLSVWQYIYGAVVCGLCVIFTFTSRGIAFDGPPDRFQEIARATCLADGIALGATIWIFLLRRFKVYESLDNDSREWLRVLIITFAGYSILSTIGMSLYSFGDVPVGQIGSLGLTLIVNWPILATLWSASKIPSKKQNTPRKD